ncbi:50S ribosomal protein L10 [Blattabacterium cuenoti]|uniref:50S ribosomal protein L10 n=1 Tax=Blattabacterium cuenoti TaxID=1653831 RepID=UPI00163B6B7B|nr:50S ribosomal protein L10 [Blattabacterium cuenoti]
MKKEKKKEELLKLISLLSDNNIIIYIIDVSYLNSNQISFLRRTFYENRFQMKVVKNTLLKNALSSIKKKMDPFFSILKGNTTILTSNSGSVNIPSKIIKKFHIEGKMDKPYLKGVYVDGSFYFGNKDLDKLINLKSKKDLITDILNSLKNPIGNVISSLNIFQNNFFRITEILSKKK